VEQVSLDDGEGERWRQAPGWPGYEVSDRGRVRRALRWVEVRSACPHERELGPHVVRAQQRRGRLQVKLRAADGRWRSVGVAALVLTAFLGPRPRGLVAVQTRPGVAELNSLRWAPRGRVRRTP